MSRKELYVDPSVLEWLPADTFTPIDPFEERPILDIVAAMPSPMRDVVELVGFAQYSKPDAAKELGLSIPWVHKLWSRAKEQLSGSLP
jgi:DNA-directed RNA polymerase specialized sigma24 family protein